MLKHQATWVPQPNTQRARRSPLSYDPKSGRIAYASGRVVAVRSLDNPAEGSLYTQHAAAVSSVSFAPSGFWAVSGDANGQVHVWDTSNIGAEDQVTKGPFAATSSRIVGLAWDFESKRVMAVGDGKDRFGHVFMFDSGNSVGEISGHSAQINAVSIKPSRPLRAATVGEDGLVVFYTGAPFRFAKSENRHTNAISDVAFSPDGRFFATGGCDRRVGLFDGSSGDFIKWIETGHTASVLSVTWRSETVLVTAAADSSVRATEVESDESKRIWQLPNELSNQQTGVIVASEGRVVSVSLDGTLYVWKDDSDTPKAIYGHQKPITGLATREDTVWSSSIDNRVLKWSASSGLAKPLHSHDGPAVGVTDGFSVGWDRQIRTVDDDSKTVGTVEDQPVAFAASDKFQATVSEGSLELVGGKRIDLPGRGQAVDIGICGSTQVVVAGFSNDAIVYSLPQLDQVHRLGPQRAEVSAVRLSPDGKYLAVGDTSGKILLYSTNDWSVVTTRWAFHTSRISQIDWNADSLRVVSGSQDGNVFVYGVERPGRNVKALAAHKDGVTRVQWLGSNRVVSAGNDGSIKVWQLDA